MNNKGISPIYLVLALLILVGGSYAGYYYYNIQRNQSDVSPSQNNSSGIKTDKLENVTVGSYFTINDKVNNFILKIDTQKKFEYEVPEGANFVERDVAIEFSSDRFLIIPKTRYSIGAEGGDSYEIIYHGGKLDPNVFWREYMANPPFRYFEFNINGFKAFSSPNLPGRYKNYSTLIEINNNLFLEINYYPIVQIPDKDLPDFYDLDTEYSAPAFNHYLDILKSINKYEYK